MQMLVLLSRALHVQVAVLFSQTRGRPSYRTDPQSEGETVQPAAAGEISCRPLRWLAPPAALKREDPKFRGP